jgi:hypothetical protein
MVKIINATKIYDLRVLLIWQKKIQALATKTCSAPTKNTMGPPVAQIFYPLFPRQGVTHHNFFGFNLKYTPPK